MYPLQSFVESLHQHITGTPNVTGNIIRKHSKKLDRFGDISFPLNLKKLANKTTPSESDLLSLSQLDSLVKVSKNWPLKIAKYVVNNNDVVLHLDRPHSMGVCIRQVLNESDTYGFRKYFKNRLNLVCVSTNYSGLTELRLTITHKVVSNLLDKLTSDPTITEGEFRMTLNSNENDNSIIVGSILNTDGVKDTATTAEELLRKRSLDLQLMAQHKYGLQLKSSWRDYFDKLGRASVTLEMLQNRSHKATKITLNDLQTANKGAAFIFYNCARISALLKQFDDHVAHAVYPGLSDLESIDFNLLNQSEEWELVFVFLLQFPTVVVSCVSEVQMGRLNIHQLVLFLSSLSSVFSVYYRRVKILTTPKEHLLPVMYARIYLIKAVQQVFHSALGLLDIEPIREM